MRPDTVHPVEHSFGLAVQRAFNAEGGKLVRYHPHRPPWCVPLGGWSSIRSWTVGLNLRRCLTFVAIAKGAESALQLHILSGKIAWALGSIRGNNHPAANNRIFSQLRHSRTSLSERANFILSRQRRITKQLNPRPAGWQTVIVYADHIETPLARRWKPAQILAHHGRYFAPPVASTAATPVFTWRVLRSLNFHEARQLLLPADQIVSPRRTEIPRHHGIARLA